MGIIQVRKQPRISRKTRQIVAGLDCLRNHDRVLVMLIPNYGSLSFRHEGANTREGYGVEREVLTEGSPFPIFSLLDQDGNSVTNEALLGKKSVIYFYPKDDTSGCTVEACGFQERLSDIPGAAVFGVSPDNTKSHRKFADKFGLKFTLLADTEKSLAEACGVWVEKSMYGKKYMGVERTTFVLDEKGTVTKVFIKVKPTGHAAEVIAVL
jgi:thioredoxin-dependent peroxiredoxin